MVFTLHQLLFRGLVNLSLLEIAKRCGDLELNITTQCVQFKNVLGRPGQGPDPSTMANICMKLNAKLGGINNLISRDVRYVIHSSFLQFSSVW